MVDRAVPQLADPEAGAVVTRRGNPSRRTWRCGEPHTRCTSRVAVDPKHRGKGVGKALLQFAEAEARRRGYSDIHLYTNVVMTENQLLYSRIGYAEYARREEDGFSRVYMRKVLA